jgi:hypothetical protein
MVRFSNVNSTDGALVIILHSALSFLGTKVSLFHTSVLLLQLLVMLAPARFTVLLPMAASFISLKVLAGVQEY